MKITKQRLKEIIKEELSAVNEAWDTRDLNELPEDEYAEMIKKAQRLIDEKPELADYVYKSKAGNFSKPLMQGFESEYIKTFDLAPGGVVQLAQAIIGIKDSQRMSDEYYSSGRYSGD